MTERQSARRIAVVGGGIAGLSAVHTIATRDPGAHVTLFERDRVFGGKARSHRQKGWLVEEGPNGFLDTESRFRELMRELDFESQMVAASQASKRRFIYVGGKMREVGPNPIRTLSSGILSVGGVLRAFCEPRIPRFANGSDESIHDFVTRRFGRQVAERLAGPMMLGIFAGDSQRLSIHATFPQVAAMETEHGSVLKGLRAKKRAARAARNGSPPSQDAAPSTTGKLHSFAGGMQSVSEFLVQRFESEPRIRLSPDSRIEGIESIDDGYRLRIDSGAIGSSPSAGADPEVFDAIVVAAEAWAASELLSDLSPGAARVLSEIEYPPVGVVALGYGPAAAQVVPSGFGVLVSRESPLRILGSLWESRIYPNRTPEGHVLIRCMLGGAIDPDVLEDLDDVELVDLVRSELDRLLGLEAKPLFTHVKRWERAIPQYTLGHTDRVTRAEEALRERPGLVLAGNAYRGVSFTRAAVCGIEAAERVLERRGVPSIATPR